jgi:hypothetical protein
MEYDRYGGDNGKEARPCLFGGGGECNILKNPSDRGESVRQKERTKIDI